MRRYFLVANQTLGGEHLADAVRDAVEAGPCEFHVIVPATPPREHMVWTEGEAIAMARQRLDTALERLRAMGVQADGRVGDANPVLAVEDALRERPCDEIILSTFPPGMSRWLRVDVPHMLARYGVPVRHVIAQTEQVPRR
ncbi:MAG: universal stress protein [Actinobacteria bacterium]|nr:universal stress protein [Actinomycetota bacterium]